MRDHRVRSHNDPKEFEGGRLEEKVLRNQRSKYLGAKKSPTPTGAGRFNFGALRAGLDDVEHVHQEDDTDRNAE
jgi:hypothetical protein